LLYRKHRELYRRLIEPLPRSYYAAVGGLVLALAGAAAQRPVWLAAGTALWLAVTAWFSACRLWGASKKLGHVAEMLITSAIIPVLSIYWRLRGALQFRVFYL
jgi:hypothetical protein